ncbi:hypothetical protein K2X85_16905 [bacterium]|nr:hypothetical protein [bacterium]
MPAIGGSQIVFFVRADIIFDRLEDLTEDPGTMGVIARTMRSVADQADYLLVAVEKAEPRLTRVRFVVPCPNDTIAKKKLRILAAVLTIFKQFMFQRQRVRLANADNLGDLRILANDVDSLFEKASIQQVDSTAMISLEANVAVGNVLGLFGNVFGSSIGQNFAGFAIPFDEAAAADRQEAQATHSDTSPPAKEPNLSK